MSDPPLYDCSQNGWYVNLGKDGDANHHMTDNDHVGYITECRSDEWPWRPDSNCGQGMDHGFKKVGILYHDSGSGPDAKFKDLSGNIHDDIPCGG